MLFYFNVDSKNYASSKIIINVRALLINSALEKYDWLVVKYG